MLTHERLDEMRNADIRTVDKNTLADMSGFEFDKSLQQKERARRFFGQLKILICSGSMIWQSRWSLRRAAPPCKTSWPP
jgi:hypothetical protein